LSLHFISLCSNTMRSLYFHLNHTGVSVRTDVPVILIVVRDDLCSMFSSCRTKFPSNVKLFMIKITTSGIQSCIV
jgi:hypothetical protein